MHSVIGSLIIVAYIIGFVGLVMLYNWVVEKLS
jgi:hypothetical protein